MAEKVTNGCSAGGCNKIINKYQEEGVDELERKKKAKAALAAKMRANAMNQVRREDSLQFT